MQVYLSNYIFELINGKTQPAPIHSWDWDFRTDGSKSNLYDRSTNIQMYTSIIFEALNLVIIPTKSIVRSIWGLAMTCLTQLAIFHVMLNL